MSATDGQKVALRRALKQLGVPEGAHDWVLRYLLSTALDLEVSEDDGVTTLTSYQWQRFRELAFPEWRADEWALGDAIKAAVAEASREYESQVHGQGDLFE